MLSYIADDCGWLPWLETPKHAWDGPMLHREITVQICLVRLLSLLFRYRIDLLLSLLPSG